jgi:beta-1,3-galactosyltransferase / beta-1,3-N-acetylglucosaminyltransferase
MVKAACLLFLADHFQDFGDIVQQYFHDTYFNNTLKMMMGFQWATEYCGNAQFVGFFDDDYFVNVNNAVKMLKTIKPTEYDNLVVGFVWENAMPFRMRDSKWYISLEEYPFRFFPTYVTAGSFFLPMMTAERIYAAMQFTKILRFDDVFLGIVTWKLRTKLLHNPNLHFYDYPYDVFKYRKVIAAHGFKDAELLYAAWKEQTDLDKSASKL